jgi:uncharacterized protein (DUF2141 family)
MPPHRRLLTIFISTILSALIIATGFLPASAETLVVTVRDIRNSDGDIRIALYNSADNFLVDGQTAAMRTLSAQAGELEVVFADLAPGIYAAAAFHDENGSGEFDTNFLGLPREGYGFSNDAQAILGPPDFEDAAVQLVSTVSETELSLSY